MEHSSSWVVWVVVFRCIFFWVNSPHNLRENLNLYMNPPLLQLPLNQQLAIKRTELANDRTLYAVIRTSLSFLAGALALWKVFADDASNYAAVLVACVAILTLVVGLWRFQRTRIFIQRTKSA